MGVPTPSPAPERILIVRLGAIGDVANALVFATALRERYPTAFLGWVVHPLAAPLVEGHPAIDRVHRWERGKGAKAFLGLLRGLRRERYDLAVDLQRILKSALVARLSRAPRVLGFDRARAKELSWLWATEHLAPADPTRHMVEQYLEFAAALDALPSEARHELPVDPAAEAWAEARVQEWRGAPVLVNLGASKPANRWEPERFGALARALAEDAAAGPVCLIGGPDDRAAGARALSAAGARVHDLVGQTSLPQLVSLCRRARLFVGCDTGPMHLAAAVRTPVVALFGPADPRRTGPWPAARTAPAAGGPGHIVLREPPPCAPCNRKTCNQPRHACMEDLTVERVLAAVRQRLGEGV